MTRPRTPAQRRVPRIAIPTLGLTTLVCMGADSLAGQDWTTLRSARQLTVEAELDVSVEYGAGGFTLVPSEFGQLYAITLEYDRENASPVHRFSGSRLTVGIEGNSRRIFQDRSRRGELALALSDRIPMDLSLELGAVEAELELGGLRLRSLRFASGASDTRVSVSAPNPVTMSLLEIRVGAASFEGTDLGRLNAERITLEAGAGSVVLDLAELTRTETRLDAEIGLGSLEIRVPRGVGVRLSRRSFLASLDTPDMSRQGDDFVSTDWEEATRRLVIDLEAALGSVSIQWLD